MSITFPMWFIYLWAVYIIFALINAFRYAGKLNKMGKNIAKIITPDIVEELKKSIAVEVKTKVKEVKEKKVKNA